MKFGSLAKQLRLSKRLTLRKFCLELRIDPSNWSKIERGINPPPRDEATLNSWADYFELRGERRQEFLDAAAVARNELPPDLASDERLAAQLPAFFRVMRNKEPDGEKLAEFQRDVASLNSPETGKSS